MFKYNCLLHDTADRYITDLKRTGYFEIVEHLILKVGVQIILMNVNGFLWHLIKRLVHA